MEIYKLARVHAREKGTCDFVRQRLWDTMPGAARATCQESVPNRQKHRQIRPAGMDRRTGIRDGHCRINWKKAAGFFPDELFQRCTPSTVYRFAFQHVIVESVPRAFPGRSPPLRTAQPDCSPETSQERPLAVFFVELRIGIMELPATWWSFDQAKSRSP
jgi:hypothetical protein